MRCTPALLPLLSLALAADARAGDKKEPAPIESREILSRDTASKTARVRHILIGWRDLEGNYQGGMDERGSARSKAAADRLAREVLAEARASKEFPALMKKYSEDPGSAASGDTYDVTPDGGLAKPFENLSLRLQVGEIGVVESVYGWHIIQRVE